MPGNGKTAYFLQVEGTRKRRGKVPLTNEIIVGRSTDCDLILADPSISRTHARFFVRAGDCYVEDLDSHNGIFVNEDRASWHKLDPGDVVDFGPYQIVVEPGPGSSPGIVRWIKNLLGI